MTNALSKECVETIIWKLLCQASNQRLDAECSDYRLRDLGIDSLGRHAMSVVLEAELGVVLDPDLLESLFIDGIAEDLVAQVMTLNPKHHSESEGA